MFPIELNVGITIKLYFCESIGISTYDQTSLQLFMLNNGRRKLYITFISSFFVLTSYKIVTLTYDHRYLQSLMLNNGKGVLFMTIRSSFFIMIKYIMIT